MRVLLTCTTILLTASPLSAGETTVRLEKTDDAVRVTVGGEEFAVYKFADDQPKPYFWPVRGPDGTVLTRPIERPGDDHSHHKGLWIAVDKVNEVDFWAEDEPIKNVSVDLVSSEGNPARLQVVNHWMGHDGEPIVVETTEISISPNRLMAYDITFTPAGNEKVVFGDTKEGFLGFRMVNSMREEEGGHVVNADGLQGASACWGKVSDWVDYYGPVEGKTYGVALFDHLLNVRRSRYHVRDYGLFSISPFGPRAYTQGKRPANPIILQPDSNLRLRYGVYIHAGDTEQGQVAKVYRDYLKRAGDEIR